jgi:hypothetical protein
MVVLMKKNQVVRLYGMANQQLLPQNEGRCLNVKPNGYKRPVDFPRNYQN